MKKRLIVLSLISAFLSAALAYFFSRHSFIPRPASAERASIDSFMQMLFAIASVFFAIVVVVFADSLLFFRRRPGDASEGPPIRGSANLERVWTIVPLIIVIFLATYGGVVLDRMTAPPVPPQTALDVDVLAFRFGWQFSYPQYGNIQSFDLRLPVDRKVSLSLQSKDVIHSFWVQEFGPKQDAVPGMTTMLEVTPTKTGAYQVQCSQLCGFGHTYMTAPVQVTSAADFESWAQAQRKAQNK